VALIAKDGERFLIVYLPDITNPADFYLHTLDTLSLIIDTKASLL